MGPHGLPEGPGGGQAGHSCPGCGKQALSASIPVRPTVRRSAATCSGCVQSLDLLPWPQGPSVVVW